MLPPICPLLQSFFGTLFFSLLLQGRAEHTPQPYVVYMGSSTNNRGGADSLEPSHLQLLSSVVLRESRERISLIHTYHHAFIGFSAMLTEEEAALLSGNPGVVSVFKDPLLQLHTTRSWDFLESTGLPHFQPIGTSTSLATPTPTPPTDDVIIGVIDTGIWPESPSLSEAGLGPIPARWKGTCMEGSDFKKTDCNRRLIGARYYNVQGDSSEPNPSSKPSTGSPRDTVGHGTHTASTAAGAIIHNASYYGLAMGRARGGSPSARLAVYKACSIGGCAGSTILKAIDDAIKDGVDIISISIGMSSTLQYDYVSDPIAIGAFHAARHGVLVVCSGGNDGPDTATVVNAAPWILTVAASNIDRDFQSDIVLGNGLTFKGTAINFSNHTKSVSYPLGFGGDVSAKSVPLSEASNCYPGSLDTKKTAGKIIVCVNDDLAVPRRVKKLVAEGSGALGMILVDGMEKGVAFDSGQFPFSEVGEAVGKEILQFIASNKKPTASILPTSDMVGFKPAPVVAYFSSRGPGGLTETILKPDVMAPGVNILAATMPKSDPEEIPRRSKPSNFSIRSGTSMACPHVSGAAAFVKSHRPHWTPSMIKSALMTTANTMDNMKKPVTNSSAGYANPHETGAGEINPIRALDPGLVYETTTRDYLHFLCFYGYQDQTVRSVSGRNYSCPRKSSQDLISTINYPSISIAHLDRHRSDIMITRTVTNIGPKNCTYMANVQGPLGLQVKVSPAKLVFSEIMAKASYTVTFSGKGAVKGYNFGSITWSDNVHQVRSVFAVNVV